METTDTNVVQAVYTYGNDLISMNRADANSYYHFDGLGSSVALSNSSGQVVEKYKYDAFGQPTILSPSDEIRTTSDVGNAYGFTGQQQFNEADNLVFLRARYYDPSIGRFISRDPILAPMRVGNNFVWFLPYLIYHPQDLYSYVYVANNPVNFVDPYGDKWYKPWTWDWYWIIKSFWEAIKTACTGPTDAPEVCAKGVILTTIENQMKLIELVKPDDFMDDPNWIKLNKMKQKCSEAFSGP